MAGRSTMESRLQQIGLKDVRGCDACLKPFSLDIEKYYKDNKQSREELEKKLEILEEIKDYVEKNVFNEWIDGIRYELKAVVPFGSSAGALGMKGGDLDMILCVHPPLHPCHENAIKSRANSILRRIFRKIEDGVMMRNRKWKNMEHIDTARVPIITGKVDGIEIDISISMTEGVSAQYLAAKYIDAYAKYDRRFILLAAFIKGWQKSKKTDENEKLYSRVFPSSCSVVLMVVMFMKHYGMLPNVNKKHEDKLSEIRATWERVNGGENGSFGVKNEDVRLWKSSNHNDVSLGTLFLLYIDFYTKLVNFETDKLVVETGRIVKKSYSEYKDEIVIEDVVDKSNVAQSVIYVQRFKDEMIAAKEAIIRGGNIYQTLMNSTFKLSAHDYETMKQFKY